MRFVTPFSCDLEPEIKNPTSRKIVFYADLGPDLRAGLYYGGEFLESSVDHFFSTVLARILKILTKDEK